MKFYIITPAWNALRWLPCAVRSVRDQACPSIEVHHHVQDGGSTDGSREWLETWQREHGNEPDYRFSFESAPDRGMYDAINRAWALIPEDADYTAHLNSDEQYLPGVLSEISSSMKLHPRADIALSSYLVLNKDCQYLSHRRPTRPSYILSRTICQIITCACFHRVQSFRRSGVRFNTTYRALADLIFYRDIMAAKPTVLRLPKLFTSAFCLTGSNLSWSKLQLEDELRLNKSLPKYLVKLRPLLAKWNNANNLLCDMLCEAPNQYSVYLDAEHPRHRFTISQPTARWHSAT